MMLGLQISSLTEAHMVNPRPEAYNPVAYNVYSNTLLPSLAF